MGKRTSPKKLLDEMFKITKPRPVGGDSQLALAALNGQWHQRRAKRTRKLARLLAKPLNTAFKRSGLDVDNEKHWKQLLVLLALAIYGGKGRGQPKQWSRKELRRLRNDVARIKADNPTFSEEECCKQLLKGRNSRYAVKFSTLRRKLQDAKKRRGGYPVRVIQGNQRADLEVHVHHRSWAPKGGSGPTIGAALICHKPQALLQRSLCERYACD